MTDKQWIDIWLKAHERQQRKLLCDPPGNGKSIRNAPTYPEYNAAKVVPRFNWRGVHV